MSRDGSLDAKMYYQIEKGGFVFRKLEMREWADRCIFLGRKISVYNAYVSSALLYSSEIAHKCHVKKPGKMHQKCLKRILRVML